MHTELKAKKILGFVSIALFLLSFCLILAYTPAYAQSATSTALYDDNFSYWSAGGGGSGSLGVSISSSTSTVESGTSSLQIILASGSYSEIEVGHDYDASPQNWSMYAYLSFYIYGLNSSNSITVGLRASDQNNCIDYIFQDNFLGWHQISFPIQANTTTGEGILPETIVIGTPNLSDITEIGFFFLNEPYIYYIDNVTLNGNPSVSSPTSSSTPSSTSTSSPTSSSTPSSTSTSLTTPSGLFFPFQPNATISIPLTFLLSATVIIAVIIIAVLILVIRRKSRNKP